MGNGVSLNGMTMQRRVHKNPPPILAPPGPVGVVWNRTGKPEKADSKI